jgi:hypothetical protein
MELFIKAFMTICSVVLGGGLKAAKQAVEAMPQKDEDLP